MSIEKLSFADNLFIKYHLTRIIFCFMTKLSYFFQILPNLFHF